jgi:predicted DNA-binding transcriptional regulator AlpA
VTEGFHSGTITAVLETPWRFNVGHIKFDCLPDDAFIRLYFLIAWGIVPFSASTLWRRVREGKFPAPLKVSESVTAWRVKDVRAWLENPAEFAVQASNKSGHEVRS